MAVKGFTTRKGKEVLYDDKTKKIINLFLYYDLYQDILLYKELFEKRKEK